MSKKLLLFWGTLLGGLSIWFFMSNRDNTKAKKELYGSIQKVALSIIMKLLLRPWVKGIVTLMFSS